MIEIYIKSNTNYDKNGDITLDPISCTYKDSEKLLTLEHFQDEEGRWKYIDFENVIAVEENEKKILYRIYNVVRSLYNVTAYARPLFYDLIDKVLIDVRPTNKLGQEALNIILEGTPFIGHSNLTIPSTAYYIRKNIVEALIGDIDNSFIKRWGGEFYCENYDVFINDKIGSDNGVRVEFGYNLNEIEEDINIEEVVTRIVPVGFNGIILEGNNPWIDSPLINKYTQPKMRVIQFSDVKVKENSEDEEGFNTIEEARQELIKRCNELYEKGIDKPVVNYKIDMINLANTTAYEDFKMLVNVSKGDTVTCYISHLDIDVKARVVDFEKDLLTGEYISIELGSEVENFFNKQVDIQAIVNKITNSNGTVNAGEVEGVINAIKTQFKALRDIAQPQDVRAIIFEDRVEDSPTFGCMVLGTAGFEIASSYKPGTKDWDFRTFGTGQGFLADCIIAGTIMSRNGTSWLSLDNGTFSYANGKLTFDGLIMKLLGRLESTNNGRSVIVDNGMVYAFTDNVLNFALGNNALELYDFYNPAVQTKVGELTSSRNKNTGTLGIALISDEDKQVTIGYKTSPTTHKSFVMFNKSMNYGVQYPINVLENMYFWDNVILGFGRNPTIGGTTHIRGYNGVMEINLPSNNANTGLWIKNSYTGQDFAVFQNGSNYKCYMRANTAINGNLHADGNITCNGSKTRVVDSNNYGKIRLNAYETPDCLFSDYGSAKIGEDGLAYVTIDDKFLETVNTNRTYRILLTAIDEEDKFEDIKLKVIKKDYNYFVVKGNPGLEFDWNIIAKQNNYEDDRLINHDIEMSMEEEYITKINLLNNDKNNIREVEKSLTENIITTEDELMNEITLTEDILMNGGI